MCRRLQAHHDVARVQVRVYEVVLQHHLKHNLVPKHRQLFVMRRGVCLIRNIPVPSEQGRRMLAHCVQRRTSACLSAAAGFAEAPTLLTIRKLQWDSSQADQLLIVKMGHVG